MATGILEVLLVNAHGIKDEDIFANISSYVVIQYGNQEHKSCVAQGQGKKRVWNEKFVFHVEYPGGEDHNYKLTLKIMDKHKLHGDVFVGETIIYLKDLVALGIQQGKYELQHSKYRIVLPNNSYAGEISIAATCTLKA